MHTYAVLTDQADLDTHLLPVLKTNGSEIPAPGCYIAAVEFDESGAVVAYQMAQSAPFLEGLWARDNSAHLLRLFHMTTSHLKGLGYESVMTMAKQDETGERIGALAEKLGLVNQHWNVYRGKI